ncbi:MAG: ComEC/Rec2 family competence protein [Ruminococcus sp.]|nr:ComEC/Rec2 family competence protein [Ruminococcus sp.]
MTRKAAWCGLSFLFGTALFCVTGGSFIALAAAASSASVLAALLLKRYRLGIAAAGISLLCGLTAAKTYYMLHIDPALELSGRTVTVEGTVTDIKVLSGDRSMLTVDGKADGVSVKVLIYADGSCEPYEKVNVTAKLEALEDTPSFPSKSYRLPKGIYLSGNADEIEYSGECGNRLGRWLCGLRDYVSQCITAAMDKESAAFAQAILCGDRSELSDVTKTQFYRSGVGHLFAMSGTHLTVIAAFSNALLGLFIRRKRVRTVLLCVVVMMFTAFGGFSAPLVRAGIMSVLTFCSTLAGRRTDPLSSLGICAVIMCGIEPPIVLSASFVCSFAACFAIGSLAPPLTSLLKGRRFAFALIPMAETAVILTVSLPFSVYFFSEVSAAAPVSNLLIVPLCSGALMLCAAAMLFGGSILPAKLIFRLADLLIKAVLKLAEGFASLRFAAVGSRFAGAVIAAAAVMAAALYLAVRFGKARIFALGTAAAFVSLWAVSSIFAALDGRVRIHILSDGRTLCAVVSRGRECAVLDIGAKGSDTYNVQQDISRNGITRCRAAFVHGDLGASAYRTEIFPPAEQLITGGGYYSEPFDENASAELDGFTVTVTAEGYDITAAGGTVSLTKNKVYAPQGELGGDDLKACPEILLGADR